ncbi:hypothetical protein BN2127_JRS10_04315 [Bacillus subtilis]|nr:hypothetical protein BN2127_JRS10_04315 [Bacillus subtilis]
MESQFRCGDRKMIFLFRFDRKGDGMDFVLNEKIAEDITPYYDEMLRDLVKSLCSILEYYKVYNKEKNIFPGVIQDNREALENLYIYVEK